MSLENVKQIIAVHSAKGGVGKSTMTVNLATGLAARGARVGLLDADVHGPSGAIMLGNGEWPDPGQDENTIHPVEAHGVKFISMGNIATQKTPLIWRGAMVHSVITQFLNNVLWGELDYLFVDMPPGTGDAQLSLAQSVSLSGVIVVSTPQELSLVDTLRGIRGFEQMKTPVLGLIENMSWFDCGDCGERLHLFGEEGAVMLSEELNIPLLGRIPIEPSVCASGDDGTPFVLAHQESASNRAMQGVLDRVSTILEERTPTRTWNFKWRQMDWNERYPEPETVDENPDAAIKAVWQVSNDELGICWPNGDISTLSAREMRLACPCASCVDEWTGKPLLDPSKVDPQITFKEIRSMGRYALAPIFSDNHSSGIFHFARIQAILKSRVKES